MKLLKNALLILGCILTTLWAVCAIYFGDYSNSRLEQEQPEYEVYKRNKEASKQSLLDCLAFYNDYRPLSWGYPTPLHFEPDYLKNVVG